MLTIEGDFGLASPLDEQHLNLVVRDVSGHDIRAALVANRMTQHVAERRAVVQLGDRFGVN